ncbi:J domain-containing protein [Candidatus Woesearchaeota archaeon]|nr:J domain-containing protein [Candidatus Woesearchaeota archaeon]
MPLLTIKGHEFNATLARDSYSRRALQYKNNIIETLGTIGVASDDIDLEIEPVAIKNAPASVTWYADGYRLYYSYKAAQRYVDNLYIVSRVIEFEVIHLLEGKKTFEEFLLEFAERDDVEHTRKEARKIIGVEENCLDMEIIDKKYKELAKKYHPDMPDGDTEMFKKINNAHKVLKRELQ